jgi:hypothetical protein
VVVVVTVVVVSVVVEVVCVVVVAAGVVAAGCAGVVVGCVAVPVVVAVVEAGAVDVVVEVRVVEPGWTVPAFGERESVFACFERSGAPLSCRARCAGSAGLPLGTAAISPTAPASVPRSCG